MVEEAAAAASEEGGRTVWIRRVVGTWGLKGVGRGEGLNEGFEVFGREEVGVKVGKAGEIEGRRGEAVIAGRDGDGWPPTDILSFVLVCFSLSHDVSWCLWLLLGDSSDAWLGWIRPTLDKKEGWREKHGLVGATGSKMVCVWHVSNVRFIEPRNDVQWGDKSIDPNPAYATRSCRVAFSSHTHLFCRLSG